MRRVVFFCRSDCLVAVEFGIPRQDCGRQGGRTTENPSDITGPLDTPSNFGKNAGCN